MSRRAGARAGANFVERRTVVRLHEDARTPGRLRVDWDRGIIYGAKVCGTVSANERLYPLSTLREAVPLYEGRPVYCDHAEKGRDLRPVSAKFGELRHVVCRDDGLYGDIVFLKSHPMARPVCEAAQRGLALFGLSHNAEGEAERRPDGKLVIKKLTCVHSVDIVSDPATTRSLAEASRRHQAR